MITLHIVSTRLLLFRDDLILEFKHCKYILNYRNRALLKFHVWFNRLHINILFCFCNPGPSSFDCDFENGFCSWQQSHDDNFDWKLNFGPTFSQRTGPTTDHTLKTSKCFTSKCIEATLIHKKENTPNITAPIFFLFFFFQQDDLFTEYYSLYFNSDCCAIRKKVYFPHLA